MENIMSSKLFRTRQGTILLGVIAAVLAAIALIVYLNQYTNNANAKAVPVPVLVAQGRDREEHVKVRSSPPRTSSSRRPSRRTR